MTKRAIAVLPAAALLLAACGAEPFWSVNEPDDVATWLRNVESPSQDEMWVCGSQWREGGMAAVDAEDVRECEALAVRLSRMMETTGFGEATIGEVAYPPLWQSVRGMRMNGFDPELTRGTFPSE